jgi:hypothetical protein
MSHEALYNSKLRLKTSIKQSLFPWKKPRHSLSLSGGLASISSRERYYFDHIPCILIT